VAKSSEHTDCISLVMYSTDESESPGTAWAKPYSYPSELSAEDADVIDLDVCAVAMRRRGRHRDGAPYGGKENSVAVDGRELSELLGTKTGALTDAASSGDAAALCTVKPTVKT
jgi:hypothetical protein